MAEFGYHTIGTVNEDNPSLNYIWGKFTSTPSNGTLDTIFVYCRRNPSGPSNPTMCVAFYGDTSGHPGARLAQNTTGVTVGDSDSWVGVSISASLVSGTQYYWCINMPGNLVGPGDPDILVWFDTPGGTELWFKDHSGTPTTFPDPAPAFDGNAAERWSVYATYTATGGGAPQTLALLGAGF